MKIWILRLFNVESWGFRSGMSVIHSLTIGFLVLSSLCTSVAYTQECRISQQSCQINRCVVGYWTGSVIGSNPQNKYTAYILSCAHSFVQTSPVGIDIGDEHFVGKIVALDKSKDLSVIQFTCEHPLSVYPLYGRSVPVASQVRYSGYSRGSRQLDVRAATVVRYTDYGIVLNRPSAQGMSGGPILYEDCIIGVIQATDFTCTYGANVTSVKDFVVANLGFLPSVSVPQDPKEPKFPEIQEPKVPVIPQEPAVPKVQEPSPVGNSFRLLDLIITAGASATGFGGVWSAVKVGGYLVKKLRGSKQQPTYPQEPLPPAYVDPRVQDPRVQDPRVQDPRVQDPRVQDPRVQVPQQSSPMFVRTIEPNFIQVPVDETSAAYDWAMRQMKDRYPGSVEVLTMLQNLVNQYKGTK